MGLDMYLTAELYIGGNYEHRNVKGDVLLTIGEFDLLLPGNMISEITCHMGYWRKANQIHNWFVENCQDGEDDCRVADVMIEQLLELKEDCEAALVNQDSEMIPPTSGFFFGSTDIDEYYWECLRDTIEIIDKCIEFNERFKDSGLCVSFHYSSSW
jgi:hypothetical protein